VIVRMSKVEIVGPKEHLQHVLGLISSLGILQIEPSKIGFVEKGMEEELSSFALDEKTLFERLFLEDLKEKIDKLFAFLPKMPVRKLPDTPVHSRHDLLHGRKAPLGMQGSRGKKRGLASGIGRAASLFRLS